MYPASTTKVLTAICVIENADMEDVVAIDKNAVGIEGSSIYLREGEKLTVKELLYGLMLRSGNDAATALALHVGKTIEDFASLMNETAKKQARSIPILSTRTAFLTTSITLRQRIWPVSRLML